MGTHQQSHLDHLPRILPHRELLSGPWEEETCNYLNEKRWEEYSLECCLTGFSELGVISGYSKHVGQHRADFSLSGKSGHRRWGNRLPTRNLKKKQQQYLKYRNGISRAGVDIREGRIAP